VNGTLFATGRNIRDGRPINFQQLDGIVIFLSNENRSGREDQAAAKQYYLDGTWQPPTPQRYGGMETRMYASDVRTGLNVFDHTAQGSDDEQEATFVQYQLISASRTDRYEFLWHCKTISRTTCNEQERSD
jgi:hypothetical protein